MNIIRKMKFTEGYKIKVVFDDGFEKTINIEPFINEGISKELKDRNYFLSATIESGGGITWPNGYDFCPEFIRNYL